MPRKTLFRLAGNTFLSCFCCSWKCQCEALSQPVVQFSTLSIDVCAKKGRRHQWMRWTSRLQVVVWTFRLGPKQFRKMLSRFEMETFIQQQSFWFVNTGACHIWAISRSVLKALCWWPWYVDMSLSGAESLCVCVATLNVQCCCQLLSFVFRYLWCWYCS